MEIVRQKFKLLLKHLKELGELSCTIFFQGQMRGVYTKTKQSFAFVPQAQ